MNQSDVHSYINSLSHSGKPVKDLKRIASLLHDLGDPQDRLRFIHIAGTNGKGSIAQMLNEICIDAGLRTGLFTSPYIFRFNDRIRIDNTDISDSDLAKYADTVKKAAESSPYVNEFSQFEITMSIAFLYYLDKDCDIVVLEAGIGGLLDCTNIIKSPLACVIGSVSFDHTQILGDTIEEIASQKAGIIKEGSPCILSSGSGTSVERIFSETAKKVNSPLTIPDESFKTVKNGISGSEFLYKGQEYRVSMQGKHMIRNACAVIEVCNAVKDKLGLSEENIRNGLKKAVVPARVQVLSEKPLLLLDGAHNPDGMAALAETIQSCGKRPCKAVIGMCRDKNIISALEKLTGTVDEFFTCDGFSDRAESREKLAEVLCSLGAKASPCRDGIYETVKELMHSNSEGITLICGSLYLCSEILTKNYIYDFSVTI